MSDADGTALAELLRQLREGGVSAKSADEAFARAYRRVYDEATANGPIPDDDMQRIRDEANRVGMQAEARELERLAAS